MIGLGRMGGNMARRLHDRGYDVAGFDMDFDQLCDAASSLRWSAGSITELVGVLAPRRIVWSMVPAGDPTGDVIDQLAANLSPGDIVIDGGNSHYKDSVRHADELARNGIKFLDVGVSGGVWGLAEGYCLMAGGDAEAYAEVEPAFKALSADGGFALVGPSGAGHYTKMVHNAIECAMMEAYGEGFELLEASPFGPDCGQIASLWLNGSVIRSWMLDLCTKVFANDPKLQSIKGWTEDSGEERTAVSEAVELGVPVPAVSAGLFARYRSWETDDFSAKLIAAVRHESGGHSVLEAFPDVSDAFASEEEAA
jgi:6-phosphogluconate dehydrogenase